MRLLLLLTLALAAPAAEEHVAFDATLDHAVAAPGSEVLLVARFVIEPGWHLYWRNPGDSGLPPSLTIEAPTGVTLGEPRFPVPQRLEASGLVSFAFEDELLLPVTLALGPDLTPGPITLVVEADWLVCREACLPGSGRAELQLEIGDGAQPHAAGTALAHAALARLPATEAPWRCTARLEGGRLVIDLHPRGTDERPETLRFFPATEGVIDLSADQTWTPGPLPQLTLERLGGTDLPPTIKGLLVAGDGRAWQITAPIEGP